MGDEYDGGDSQREKRAAATAYDYDGDPRWSEYWSNVLIPSHMISRVDVVDHYKRKFYQQFVDPEFSVEMSSASFSGSASRSSSSPTSEQPRPQSSGPRAGIYRTPGRSPNSFGLDTQTIRFSVNAWVLVVALSGILPLVPRNISNKAFRLSLLGTALHSFYSLYTIYGKPSAWNLSTVQTWFQSIIATKDFIHFMYCLMLVSSRLRFRIALIPVMCWSVENVARYLRRNFYRSLFYRRYLDQACAWVEANSTTLSIVSSNTEIALGFLLIISLFSWQRNILQTFMYWQLLKLMYHAPATAGFHRRIWVKIGRTANPCISHYAPFLSAPISAIQRWWLR